jgi:hypothetical protein
MAGAEEPKEQAEVLINKDVTAHNQNSMISNLAENLALLTAKDPDLATIITAWPELPDDKRKAILDLIGDKG